jgi:hypothetical protein
MKFLNLNEPSRSTVGHHRKLLLNLIFIGTCCWAASAHAVVCQVAGRGGLGGASPDLLCGPPHPPPPPPPAPAANGSKPIAHIDYAKDVINYASANNVCSSTYITNSSYLTECQTYISAMGDVINAWKAQLDAGTLTVAYDATVETELYNYETALQAVLKASGYSYTPSSAVSVESARSLAYQISPDEISPDDATSCTVCITTRIAAAAVCGATIEVLPVSLLCLLAVAGDAYLCYQAECAAPTEPPKVCG